MAGTCVWACVSDRAARGAQDRDSERVVRSDYWRHRGSWSASASAIGGICQRSASMFFLVVVVVVDCWLTVGGEASDDAWQYTEKFNVINVNNRERKKEIVVNS